MIYPEFNSLSVVSLLISLSSMGLILFFIKISIARIKNIENKLNNLIKSFNILATKPRETIKKETIDYMEGDIDLMKEGKKATFKAIYYPRKINKK